LSCFGSGAPQEKRGEIKGKCREELTR